MTTKSRGTVGYVVVESGWPLAIGESNVLWVPSGRVPLATLFATLAQARRAIERTKEYASSHGYNWSSDYRVSRLRAE